MMTRKNSDFEQNMGNRLKQFAVDQFGSVAELERTLGKGRNYLQRYVDNKSKAGSDTLAKLSDLGLNVNWLLTGDGLMMKGKGGKGINSQSAVEFVDLTNSAELIADDENHVRAYVVYVEDIEILGDKPQAALITTIKGGKIMVLKKRENINDDPKHMLPRVTLDE